MSIYKLIKNLIISSFVISLIMVGSYNVFCYCYNIVLNEIGYGQIYNNYNVFFNRFSATNEEIENVKNAMYISTENSDWLISDYADGVCINKYLGNEKVVVIPEMLDGKKVLMLGCNFILQDDDPVDSVTDYIACYHTVFDNTNIVSITIPSTIKEITLHTFRDVSASDKPTLKEIIVDENNVWFDSNEGEISFKNTNRIIYSYRYESIRYIVDNIPLPLV